MTSGTTPGPGGGAAREPDDDPRNGERDRLRGLYRRLLSLYPPEFRRLYARDLLEAFDDRREEPRFHGLVGGLRLMTFLVRDFLTSVPMAYRQTTSRKGMDGMMNDVLRDLRFSVRMLLKNPMFTLAAVATLALGIGLNTATFSAVHGILLRPLPGAEAPEELVQVYREWPGITYGSNSVPHYQDLRDRTSDVFDGLASWYFEPMAIATTDGDPERVMGMVVSANFFQTYGAPPALGRPFLPQVEDRGPGAHPVAVLGHGYWQSRFGGDPSVVGSTISINGNPFEIVGVGSEDFAGPISIAAPPVFVPLMMANVLTPAFNRLEARGSNNMSVVGRMRDDMGLDRVRDRLDAVLAQLREEYPDQYENQLGHTLVPQTEAGIHPTYGSAQTGLSTVLLVVVGLLLLIACVNVANLFLARARDRRQEMGIRMSLGAGRGRIVQQLLVESLLFATLAGLAGVVLARLSTGFLERIRPPVDGPWAVNVEMSPTVLGFTAVISMLAGLVFGLAPALHAARSDTASAMKGGATGKISRSPMSSGLVVAQVALSLLLLISSGLFLRNLQAATRIDPGFDDPGNLAMTAVDPRLQGYDESAARAFWDRMLEEVSRMPQVSSAGLTLIAPLGLSSSDRSVSVPGYEFAPGERSSLQYSYISEGYLEAMGTELLEGRTFDASDDADSEPVMVVNERFADRFWPGESAVGKTMDAAGETWTVVGVVETGKYRSLGEEPTEFMYFPYRRLFRSDMTLVARTAGDPQPVLQAIRRIVRDMDPEMPVYDVRTMESHMGIALLPARLGGTVLGIFGLLGLVLAAIGIYGVMAYSVSQRKRELGIRLAMGADRPMVLRLIVGQGMRLALVGTALGLVGALAAAQLLRGLLYDLSPVDPVAFTVVPLTLMGVAALAVYLPARRAAAVDPMKTLKSD